MMINPFKKSSKQDLHRKAEFTVSSNGAMHITTEGLLKNKAIKKQYELLKNPEYRTILKGNNSM